jgi:glutamyl-tRNA synthetase
LFVKEINVLSSTSAESFKAAFEKVLEESELGFGKVMPGLRLALTGQGGGPDLMGILAVLGVEEAAKRINLAIEKLDNGQQKEIS